MINHSSIWSQLHQHQRATSHIHMRDLFANDSQRFDKMNIQLNGLLLDYSKNRITYDTLALLIELAYEAKLPQWINKMRCGEKINSSEGRAVLHIVSRLPENTAFYLDGEDIAKATQHTLQQALTFADQVREGQLKGATGKTICDVVNLGIGGSDLGPRMLTQALKPYHGQVRVHYVANVHASDLAQTLEHLDAETTLFIIASKSFTTPETLLNARMAREWLTQRLPENTSLSQHWCAVSNNIQSACEFGVLKERVFPLAEWVGGRYSATSVVGLSAMCAIGSKHFRQLLAGANAMDEHFFHTPYDRNMPVLLALIGIWYNTFYKAHSHAIIPYEYGLRRFPAHIQQLDMESNGKQSSRNGEYLDFDTGPIIWGEEGVNCQHAFFQLLHQGTRLVPSDFILIAKSCYANDEQQQTLIANALAQTRALMQGKTQAQVYTELEYLPSIQRDTLVLQKYFPGNQPSNTLFLNELTPFNLGMLLALYEHKVFVQGVIWGINSFDQWGVEYGKVLARDIQPHLANNQPCQYDSSTNGLIEFFRQQYN